MPELIRLQKIVVKNNHIEYKYSVSDALKKFFLDTPFFLEYSIDNQPMDMSSVPKSILAIPFICNILPIVWITDSKLEIPELDQDFYDSIPKIKAGYQKVFSKVQFGGEVNVKKIIKNKSPKQSKRSAVFYSGGVDSWCTLGRHLDEKPELISIWVSDVEWNNISGWKKLFKTLQDSVVPFNLSHIVVKSTFRKAIYEDCLTWTFENTIQDNWWHGMQHGIGIIAHSAPCNYLRGVSKQYIAATYSDKNVLCASHPDIDEKVRFFGCKVFHDAFITRQQKVKEIIKLCEKIHQPIKMHVCWESTSGTNCCKCEKCCRTIYGLLVSGASNLTDYGFDKKAINFRKIKKFLKNYHYSQGDINLWRQIQQEFIKNELELKRKKYYRQIKWLKKFNFGD